MNTGAVVAGRHAGWRRAVAALSMLWAATMLGAGLTFLTQTLLARTLGPAAYGLFASSLGTVTMLAPLAGFGLSQFRLKAYGTEGWNADRWLRPSLRFTAITTAMTLALVLGWALLGAPDTATRTTLLLLSPVVLSLLAADLVGSKLRLEESHQVLAWWQLVVPTSRFLVAAALLLVPAWASADFAAWGYCAVAVVTLALAWPQLDVLMRGRITLKGHGPRDADAPVAASPKIRELWSEAWAYGLTAALYPVFFQVSTVMLKYLGSDSHAGLYGVAMAIMAAIYLIPTTVYHKFLLSKLHRWAVHDRPKFWRVYRQGIVAMGLCGLAIGIALAALSPWLVPLAFGEKYRGVVAILCVLALCPPIRFLSTAIGSVLLTGRHMRYRVWAMGSAAAVVIGLNLVLLPRFHGMGAAVATVIGELALLFFMWRGARKHGAEYR